jgi:type VI protein secretion system component Hcp
MNLKNSKEDNHLVTSPQVADDTPELSAEELDSVTGGKVSMQEFHFTSKNDKSSPNLMGACATGKHFPTATITVR